MVKVGFLEDEPIILAAVGVMISQTPFEEGNIQDIYEKCRENRKVSRKLVNDIMNKHKHMILGDFLPYVVTFEDMSRLAAIYLWRNVSCFNAIYGAGIEASMRVIKPNRYNEIVSDLGKMAFETYEKAINLGVPEQDARYMLPEGVLTRMILSIPPRYLVKLANVLEEAPLSELQEIGKGINSIVRKEFGLEIPREEPVSDWNFFGALYSQKDISFNFNGDIHAASLEMGITGSLAMYAQLVRQRQFLCLIESMHGIAKRSKFVVPPTFPKSLKEDYKEIAFQTHKKQYELIEGTDPNFAYFLLLGQQAKARIYSMGQAIMYTASARSDGVAQWEIRNELGIPLVKQLMGEVAAQDIGPGCWRFGRCTEPITFKKKKAHCAVFEKSGGKWKGTLEEMLETLQEKYETFEIR
jgi:thymidylate synthase ThyX